MLPLLALVATTLPVTAQSATAAASSPLRIAAVATANSIAAVGRTPELAEPLPFGQVSPAEVLGLDRLLIDGLQTELTGGEGADLEEALDAIDGVDVLPSSSRNRIQFTLDITRRMPLRVAHDDGDLRFADPTPIGTVEVTLATAPEERFVLVVDPDNPDPLLKATLSSQPILELGVAIGVDGGPSPQTFRGRQGFTEVDVTADRYQIARTSRIRMRDPNGRSVLTLEDLAYSNLSDLFRVTSRPRNEIDIRFGIGLPSGLGASGDPASGEMTLTDEDTQPDAVWPAAADADQTYGADLAAATGFSVQEGVAALARYGGAALALQGAARVEFPQLQGDSTDVFAPGDLLSEVVTAGAAAQVRCGLSPTSPPVGVAAPGDTVYCDAVTGTGLADLAKVTWTVADGDGTVQSGGDSLDTVGPAPTKTVRIDGSDGEPDVMVTIELEGGSTVTARPVPRTVQDVIRRIESIDDDSAADAEIVSGGEGSEDDALNVQVTLAEASSSTRMGIGDPHSVGALVSLTGMSDGGDDSSTTVTASDAAFTAGFGMRHGESASMPRVTLRPQGDQPVVRIGDLSVAELPSDMPALPARVGFLGVEATVDALTLETIEAAEDAVSMSLKGGEDVALGDIFSDSGTLDPDTVKLSKNVRAGIALAATERPLPDGSHAVGGDEPATGTVAVTWDDDELPDVTADDGYGTLRLFDPVAAQMLSGTAKVLTPPGGQQDDGTYAESAEVVIDVSGVDLYERFRAAPEDGAAEVTLTRRLVTTGAGCDEITILSRTRLTCAGLVAHDGTSALHAETGSAHVAVEFIVLGDPFAMRDGLIEGLSAASSSMDQITSDNIPDPAGSNLADQYTSTLPLVDLTPASLATERQKLAEGLDSIRARAAQESEGGGVGQQSGGSQGSSGPVGVSSLQELADSVDDLVPGTGESIDFELTERTLDAGTGPEQFLDVVLEAPSETTMQAPLRFTDGDGHQVKATEGAGLTVDVQSSTALGVSVALHTAAPAVTQDSRTISRAVVDPAEQSLAGSRLAVGVGDAEVLEHEPVAEEGGTTTPSRTTLDVTVKTSFDPGDRRFETVRSTARKDGNAAVAHLDIQLQEQTEDVATTLDYTAGPTGSSGGDGTLQAPKKMQVRFLAEGLDGLAGAFEEALDGTAATNTSAVEIDCDAADAPQWCDGVEGSVDVEAPRTAPLVGADLDAGADVGSRLRQLTSGFRDQLEKVPATTAEEIDDAVVAAFQAAASPDGGSEVTASQVEAKVTCGDDPCADGATADVWDTLSLTATLHGAQRESEVPFDTGLAGLAVRSDKTVDVTTAWTLPIELQLVRGTGPTVVIADGDALSLQVDAAMTGECSAEDPRLDSGGSAVGWDAATGEVCTDAIVGYLPAVLSTAGEDWMNGIVPDGGASFVVEVTPTPGEYDLFAVHDGELVSDVGFDDVDQQQKEDGLVLGFKTMTTGGGPMALRGVVSIPWTPAEGYEAGDVEYQHLGIHVGQIAASLLKPFEVLDPYLSPVREVADALHADIPVLTDISTMVGDDPVTLLRLAEQYAVAGGVDLTMVTRIIELVGSVASLAEKASQIEGSYLPVTEGSIGIAATKMLLYEKCKQSIHHSTTGNWRNHPKSYCPGVDILDARQKGRANPTQARKLPEKAKQAVKPFVGRKEFQVVGSVPGFSLPFLNDPEQVLAMVRGTGATSYFRMDMGSLSLGFAYTQSFGPIMIGPVPLSFFVGLELGTTGKLAFGFDSHPQVLATEHIASPGDVDGLLQAYDAGELSDTIDESFYIDDLDSSGEDIDEVEFQITVSGGAGVSLYLVAAGIKAGATFTLGADLNDPDGDGRLRTAEIRQNFSGEAQCAFVLSGTIELFIAAFVRLWLFAAPLEMSWDIARTEPLEISSGGCKPATPTLVRLNGDKLELTVGAQKVHREHEDGIVHEEYEVRQYDTRDEDGKLTTRYEVSAFGFVQSVISTPDPDSDGDGAPDGYAVTIYESGTSGAATGEGKSGTISGNPMFVARAGDGDDRITFGAGEAFIDGELVTTPFSGAVDVEGGPGNDTLVTGSGDDTVAGGAGDDTLESNAGDDKAEGGDGNDALNGGGGDDILFGHTSGDVPEAVETDVLDDDTLQGGPGADRADGGPGNDTVLGGPGRDPRAVLVRPAGETEEYVRKQVLAGFDSGDLLVGGIGADQVDGGEGSDVVIGGTDKPVSETAVGQRQVTVNVLSEPGGDVTEIDIAKVPSVEVLDDAEIDRTCRSGSAVEAASIADRVTGGPERDIVVGGDGPDMLDGGEGPDEMCGRAGNDLLSGDGPVAGSGPANGGDDVVRGGHGDDVVTAGPGDDTAYGDDVDLLRGPEGDRRRVLDGTLGGNASGSGDDYIETGPGGDVVSGGRGVDQLVGGEGDDTLAGEGADTATGTGAPPAGQRFVACNPETRVIRGRVDLDGDLAVSDGAQGLTQDSGRIAGHRVADGLVQSPATGESANAVLGEDTVLIDGKIDLDRDGDITAADTGIVPLPSNLDLSANTDGDCILGNEGDDALRGGLGSDHITGSQGRDLLAGGDWNDLLVGGSENDVLTGDRHDDLLVGADGDDRLTGGHGDDRLRGNEGDDDLVGGRDANGAADGQDVLLAGRGEDLLAAENAAVRNQPLRVSIASATWSGDAEVPETLRNGTAPLPDPEFKSAVRCGSAAEVRWVRILAAGDQDRTAEQSPGTPTAYDELFGGYGCDWVFGSIADDLVRGGQDDDVVEAGPGEDIAHGDHGHDVVVGGSSLDHGAGGDVAVGRSGAGEPDGGDEIHGDGGPDGLSGADLIAGDNAVPIRNDGAPDEVSAARDRFTVRLFDLSGAPATTGAGDEIDGGPATGASSPDVVFGQRGDDVIGLGAGDDYAEGNAGRDAITGAGGDDRLIGGSSAADGQPLGADGSRLEEVLDAAPYDASAAGVPDGADEIRAGAGSDVTIGDNGRITRPAARGVDVALTDETSAGAGGGDAMYGDAGDDRMYGELADDEIWGGPGADYVEGNRGADRLNGGADADTVVGGSSTSPASDLEPGDVPELAFADGDDVIGGDVEPGGAHSSSTGGDLLFGDNATVIPLPGGRTFAQLGDVGTVGQPADPANHGDDTIGAGPEESSAGDADVVFGQAGDDTIGTGADSDYVEGNSGVDTIRSGAADDDVLGGSSSAAGRPFGAAGDRLLESLRDAPGEKLTDGSAAGVPDGADDITGGGGEDVVLGDNGRITRPGGTLESATSTQPLRHHAMADLGPGATSAPDSILGGSGDDLLIGQLDRAADADGVGDRLAGNAGDDVLQGDLAVVTLTPVAELGDPTTLTLKAGEVHEDVYPMGTLVPVTHVPEGTATRGGPDRARGGEGADTLRMGGAPDLATGDAGADVVFGGHGDDVLWGGADDDRIFGGHGADDLDLKPRAGDPASYDDMRAPEDTDGDPATINGSDFAYGGWGPDELQADTGEAGPDADADVLIDWFGAHNVYYVCEGYYGPGRVYRQPSPDMDDLLVDLVLAHGGLDVERFDSGGWFDLGLVQNRDARHNTDPSPEYPGNFTCEGDESSAAAESADPTGTPEESGPRPSSAPSPASAGRPSGEPTGRGRGPR